MGKISFHFKLNNQNFEKLESIKKELELKNRSEAVELFIEKGMNYINTIYDSSSNHKSRRPENDKRIKELRIKMELKHYRKFKKFHDIKNLFSIAVIIRSFIYFFG